MTNTMEQFIIEVTLIDPIKKIIQKLENHEFRDCDVKWLDDKTRQFTDLALQTLGLEINLPDDVRGKIIKDYTTNQFISRFQTLLNYFNTYLN